jgi:hypothetical protein
MKKSLINRIALGTLSVLFIALQSSAMESDTARMKKPTLHYGFIGVGAVWFDNSKLNDYLNSMGVSSFKDLAVSVSLGQHNEYDRIILEGALSANFWKDNITVNMRTSLWCADVIGNVGCNTLPKDMPVRLFPLIGVGLAGNYLHVNANKKTLSEFIKSKEPNSALWQMAILFNAGIGSDFVLPIPGKKSGFAMGVRAGYRLDLYTAKNWTSDGTTITDVPQLLDNGGYVRLIIGGWSGKHMKKQCCSPDSSKG